MENNFNKLREINVNNHTEKKGELTYLSWAWAVDTLLQQDPAATWEYKEPIQFNNTLMVFCTVTAFGKAMTSQLPVMDYKNKAITNPDAMAVNTAMQRCLAKAIALHGLGLYIYAGEDLPAVESPFIAQLKNIAENGTEALTAYHAKHSKESAYRKVWEVEAFNIKEIARLADEKNKPIPPIDAERKAA